MPVYADTGYEGDFSTNELPYGIEFVKLAQSDGVGTAAIDKDGNIWTWGDAGAWLGQGSSYPGGACITPKKITTNIKFVDIIGNRDPQFMAIDINGNIWSVGRKSSKYVEDISTLTQFTSGTVYKKIHVLENAGGMAIDEDGYLWTWGSNDYGQLGDGTKNASYVPKQIKTDTKFKDISGAFDSAAAIDEDGNLWTWGLNEYGQLGNGSTTASLVPIKIMEGTKFKSVSKGEESCAAIDEDGNLWTWGRNSAGQLGNGTTSSAHEPIHIMDGVKFESVKIMNNAIAIDEDGNLWTWGWNKYGQLGNATTTDVLEPIKIKSGTKFKYISEAGITSIATDEGGSTWMWGYNKYANLGNGVTDSIARKPIQITDPNKKYTVNFYDEDGSTLLETKSVTSGSNASASVTPTKQETAQYTYTFEKWVAMDGSDIDLSNITANTDVKAKYKGTLKSYNAIFNNYNGEKLASTSVEYGKYATYNGSIPIKSLRGYTSTFTGWNPNLSTTAITENTTFTAQFEDRLNNYKITYTGVDDATFENNNPETYTVETNSFTLNNPSKKGYTFVGWEGTDLSEASKNVVVEKGCIGDREFNAVWSANTNTPYKIEHYKQKNDGTYRDEADETENRTGTTGSTVVAEQKNYNGYTYDIGKSNPTGTVAGDGSLVLKLYYKANTSTGYKVEHYKQKADGSYGDIADETENLSGTTGESVNAIAKEYAGYTEDTKNSNRVESGTIAGDGSLVLKLYYKANTSTGYKVEHYKQKADGSYENVADETENLSGTTGASVTATAKEYAGYTEDTENSNRVDTGTIAGDGSLVLKLYYKANTSTGYKVEHYKQKADGSYGDVADETENLSGTTGAQATATAKEYAGYTEDTENSNRIASGTIVGDGSLVLKLYYKANTSTGYKVEHYKQKADGSYSNVADETENLSGTTGASVNATAKEYAGYTEDTENSNRIASGTIVGDGSLVLKLYYKANTSTGYKVEHYKQKADGSYGNVADETENLSGTTGESVNATAKEYAGYTEDTENSNRIASGTIAGDGSLVLKLYYKANTSTGYKVEHYKQKADGSYGDVADETENLSGTTGESVNATAKSYAGYTEDTENINRVESGTIAGDGSLVLKLYYKANTSTGYKVEHYKQKADGSYGNVADETENLSGTTGESVNATAKEYAGYTEDTKNSNRIASGTIAGDGSLVLKLYYKANTSTGYKVEHYKQKADGSYGNVADETENLSGTTGASVNATAKEYAGYTEDTENSNRIASGTIVGDGSLVLKLYYKANTSTGYKVEHYKQKADGSYGDIADETENLSGTTGESVNAIAKEYAGYTEDTENSDRVESGTIAGDGSLVLKLYYKANTSTGYKVEHYKQKADGSYGDVADETENLSGTTGAQATATAKEYAGYTEDTENSNRVATGTIAGDGSLVLKLYYKANTSTGYKVEHYKQKADGSYSNVADETENLSGTTGASVNATAKEYAGYTEDTENSNRIASGTIAGDGSLVLKLYYKLEQKEVKKANITIKNIDKQSKKAIKNSRIEVYKGQELYGSAVTDENGAVEFKNLEPGEYTYKQINVEEEYILNTEESKFIVNEDGTVEFLVGSNIIENDKNKKEDNNTNENTNSNSSSNTNKVTNNTTVNNNKNTVAKNGDTTTAKSALLYAGEKYGKYILVVIFGILCYIINKRKNIK